MSEAASTLGSMGAVIDLDSWRRRRGQRATPMPAHPLRRLEAAVGRIERLMRTGTGRISATVETELLAITAAVGGGRVREAARRAERLAERLDHPSSSLAR
jgi:hypothetical protein